MSWNFETIPFIKNPVSFQILPNGNLLCGSYGSIMILKEKFQKIKSIESTGLSLSALNHRNEIYVSAHSKHSIVWLKLELNQLNQFGSFGTKTVI